jgi:hypothetical protein
VDGSGIYPCFNNADCIALGPAWGNCTASQPRLCFLDPVTATGVASPTDPVTVSIQCLGRTGNAGANAAVGMPGPARTATELQVTIP